MGSWFSNLAVKAKLLTAFVTVIVLTLVISVVSGFNLSSIQVSVSHADEILLGEYHPNAELRKEITKTNDIIFNFVSNIRTYNEANKSAVEQSLNHMQSEAKKILARDNSETAKTLNADIEAAIDSYKNRLLPVLDRNFQPMARGIYTVEIYPKFINASICVDQINNSKLNYIMEDLQKLNSNVPLVAVTFVTIVVVVLSLFVSFFLASLFTSQIRKALQVTTNIAKGDLTFAAHADSNDEFGKLLQSLEPMRVEWQGIVGAIKSAEGRLNQNFTDISNSSVAISESARATESRALTVAAAADEMVSTTADIAKNCHEAAINADDSNRTTQDGVQKVRTTIEAIKLQEDKSNQDAKQIQELSQTAQKIGAIVQTIDEIASQTNLLALNAAIEAARAGEAGKGFAVVADEVRALASRTSKSTQEITAMVTQVQDEANNANISMEHSVASMHQLAENASTIEDLLNGIIQKVDTVNAQIGQIATAAEQQTAATSEISTNMQNITTAAQGFATEVDNTHGIINKATQSVSDLSSLVEKIRV